MAYPIDVRGVLDTLASERVVTGEIEIGEVELGDQPYAFLGPAVFKVRLTNAGAGIVASGTAEAVVRTACVRCLCDFDMTYTGEVEAFYIFPGREDELSEEQEFEFISESLRVDIEPAVRQAMVVDLPFAPVHDPRCKGICPSCGLDRNTGECECEPVAVDSPFASLKGMLDTGGGADPDS
jgi:uncharacterized protein